MAASSSFSYGETTSESAGPDRSSVFPPPALSADGGPDEDDEALRRMMERMATHKPAPQSNDGDDEEVEDETWHDALEEEDGEGELKEEAMLSSEQLEACLTKATTLKTTANTVFLTPSQPPSTNISSALSTYLSAIASLPPRPTLSPPKVPPSIDDAPTPTPATSQPTDDAPRIEEITEEEADLIERGETDEERARKEVTGKVKELRAMLWGNVAACYLKLDQNKEAVEACTESLLDSPDYIKPLHRRLTANLALNTWSSLTSAQQDLTTLLPLLPPSARPSPLRKELEKLGKDLPRRIGEMQEKEKDEMMGKLKGLGDSLLGKFGLSTDNFKFEPNGAGGYSMNFVR